MAVESVLEGAAAAVEAQQWLDPVAERVQRAVADAYRAGGPAGQQIKDFLHGTWLGHPLHPVLTDIPIGSWTAALVLDGLEMASGRREFGAGADAVIAVGIAGAVGAAATGITDWQHTDGKARRIGIVHAVLNTAALGLYTASWLLRRRGSRGAGRGLASLGFAVANASAYLGGRLVYDERIGVDHADETPVPEFVPVLDERELADGAPRRAMADGVPVLLVRRGERILALGETCSHLGGPLAEGEVEGTSVRCPWHGSRFSLEDGRVLDGPATRPEPSFETRVREGRVEVRRRGS